ncbi:hypothetical protein Ae201684P_003183 [Aphanomyces euteiches]|nr:hypothetical protein Ae201684P_003183 [Aphanomyces euteiches]
MHGQMGWNNFSNLSDLKSNGFFDGHDDLSVSASIRLVPLSLHIYTDESFIQPEGFGLGSPSAMVDVPMCSTVKQIRDAVANNFPQLESPEEVDLWWFTLEDTVRQRSLIPQDDPDLALSVCGIPRFDSFYLDTYSMAHLYLDPSCEGSFVFIKVLDRQSGKLHCVGRLSLRHYSTPAAIFDHLSGLHPGVSRWLAVKENLPMLSAGNLVAVEGDLAQSDILICAEWHVNELEEDWRRDVARHLRRHLEQRWDQATVLLNQPLRHLTLSDLLTVGRSLDFHSHQILHAFNQCKKDARLTLAYMMEGRHLWQYCDMCGAVDFQGMRYRCTVCVEFDICDACHGKSLSRQL